MPSNTYECFLILVSGAFLSLHLHGCDSSGDRNGNIFMALQPKPTLFPAPPPGMDGWVDYRHHVCTVGQAIHKGYQITVEGRLGKASIFPATTSLNWLANNIQVCTEWNSFQYPPTRSTCKKFVLFEDTIAPGSKAYFFHDICMKDLSTADTWVSMSSSDSIRFVYSESAGCVVSTMAGGEAVSDMFSDPEYGFKSTLVSCESVNSGSSGDTSFAQPLDCVKNGCNVG